MPRLVLVLGLVFGLAGAQPGAQGSGPSAPAADFDAHFRPATLRIDYYHGGDAKDEFFVLDRIREEPGWAGSRARLVTPFERGRHQVRLEDRATGEAIFARGFSTVFGEWQTVSEARERRRIFREAVVTPFPKHPVDIVFLTRDRRNVLREKFRAPFDPASDPVYREAPPAGREVVVLAEEGPPAGKVDLTLVAEGYTAAEMDRFQADARRLTEAMFERPAFQARRRDFNVRAVCVASEEGGIDEPAAGRFRRTPLEASFDSFGLSRYVLVEDQVRLRDAVAGVPTDCLAIVVNSARYGGGGIYNWFLTVTAGNPWSEYVFVHEFGHLFAGLADEYYASAVSYEDFYPAGVEPLEPNITRLAGGAARERLKWGDLVEEATSLPTPWPQAEYDALAAGLRKRLAGTDERSDAAAREFERDAEIARRDFFRALPAHGRVGAYEGGGYVARGIYRPFLDCTMFSKSRQVPFCPVCRRAISRMIDYQTGRGP